MEFDRYDNVATEYFIARNPEERVVGVCRSYPTTIPYMLSDAFGFLAARTLPASHKIHEASRLVLDRSLLGKDARRPIVNELIVAYMERGMQRNIDAYVGFMLPRIWDSTFLRAGWDVEWLGPEIALSGSLRSQELAARLPLGVRRADSRCPEEGQRSDRAGPGTGDIVRAGLMPVNERMNRKIREATGLRKPVLNCGSEPLASTLVSYSHLRRDHDLAA
jgi:hypothetical protein